MKTCKKCGANFTPSPSQIRKNDLVCRACLRIYNGAYRAKRKAAGNPVIPGRMSEEYEKTRWAEYSQRPEVKKRKAAHARFRLLDPKQRPKIETRWRLHRALESGRIVKQPCEVCGCARVDAHHDDYSKPLAVRWLCRKHHIELHKNARAKEVTS